MSQLNQSGGPAMSTKDSNFLKGLQSKFPELESLVKKLQKYNFYYKLIKQKNVLENSVNKVIALKFSQKKPIKNQRFLMRIIKN